LDPDQPVALASDITKVLPAMSPRVFSILTACLVAVVGTHTLAEGGPTAAAPPATPATDKTTPAPFNFANVVRRAADLATKAYQPDRPDLPEGLANLDYDKYRDVRFRRDKSLWKDEGLPFQVEFFPRGFMFRDRVTINVVDGRKVTPVKFKRDLFDYGKNQIPSDLPDDIGFAGLRLLYPINRDDTFDEVAVFLGASYFRAVAQNLNYGITARGLAIDTGLPSKEEFPTFREFWLVKPKKDATDITLYALLDSERVTGAYMCTIKPGPETVFDVKTHIFARDGVKKLGIAPLTSMFFHGEDTDRRVDDFRPEVHDSDGLVIESGTGERIWRPLVNPLGLRINQFQVTNPKSFGLLQRDRVYDHYQDLEAHYQNRPSAVVEPIGSWGKGMVELVEIPSTAEKYDNIVAYWMPERPAEAGQQWEFAYRIRFAKDAESRLKGGRTDATRIGAGGTDVLDSNIRKFVVDFAGPALAALGPHTPVEANIVASSGKLSNPIVQWNPYIKGWRLFFELTPDGDGPIDLRAFLFHGNDVLSETWTFQWVRAQ
jgi:glucans biosynthesis protein